MILKVLIFMLEEVYGIVFRIEVIQLLVFFVMLLLNEGLKFMIVLIKNSFKKDFVSFIWYIIMFKLEN